MELKLLRSSIAQMLWIIMILNFDKLHFFGCQNMKYVDPNNTTKSGFIQELGDKIYIILLLKYGANL